MSRATLGNRHAANHIAQAVGPRHVRSGRFILCSALKYLDCTTGSLGRVTPGRLMHILRAQLASFRQNQFGILLTGQPTLLASSDTYISVSYTHLTLPTKRIV